MTWDEHEVVSTTAERGPIGPRVRPRGRIASERRRAPADALSLGACSRITIFAIVLLANFARPSLAETPPGTVVHNQAQISYAVGGSSFTAGSNADQFTVQASPASFAGTLALSVVPATTRPGETVLATITIANTGTQPLPAGQLVVARPAGVTLLFPPGWAPVDQGGSMAVATPDLPVGGSLVLPIDAGIGLGASLGTMVFQADYTAASVHLAASQSIEVAARSSSVLDALRYAPDRAVGQVGIPFTEYDTGGGSFAIFPPPTLPDSGNRVTDGPLPLASTSSLHGGQTFFASLLDADQNLDPAVAETIVIRAEVYLSDATFADAQTFRLTETSADSGEFLGYLQTTLTAAAPFDGLLSVRSGSRIALSYTDDRDGGDTAASGVLVDPFGMVFETATGRAIDGIQVTLLDADSNTPATVFGDDGVSSFPATVVTGAQVTDGGGQVYDLPAGGFRFPLVEPGSYRLEIALPADAGFHWPSTIDTSQIQALPGAPFAIDVGSRGEPFIVVDGPPIHLDLPIDPAARPLWLGKSASKTDAAAGELVQYRVTVGNTRSIEPVRSVVLTDVLPFGFRYHPGSARIAGALAPDPTIAGDGRTLRFHLGDLAPLATVSVTYVTQVATAPPGDAVNLAQAAGDGGADSNAAQAVVRIREDLFRSHTILMGQVADQERDGNGADGGIGGVRVFLEDGTYAVTDERGLFHFEGLRPGTHVVQLDLDTLPESFEVPPGERNSQDAGRAWSKFVDLQGGAMWRVDFAVVRKPAQTGESAAPEDGGGTTPATGEAAARDAESADANTLAHPADDRPTLSYDRAWIESAEPGLEWILPESGGLPRIPSTDVGIKHDPRDRIELSLNGSPVAKQNFEKTIANKAGTVGFSLWLGIDLAPGDNRFQAVVRNERGIETRRLERTVHYPGPPVRVALVESLSTLGADGRTAPIIALRFEDRDGFPARQDATGSYRIEPPYRAKRLSPFDLAVMPGAPSETLHYTIGPDGIALVELEPTSVAGVVKLVVPLANGDHELFATLRPALREWILVGLAQGTLSYDTITTHMEPADASASEDDLYEDGRVAFYAKGRVKAEWLATIAYDSDKPTGPEHGIYGTIDPGTYYTLYGDQSTQLYEAASGERLYLKIERDRFFAMFGDFDTALTWSELSRYTRSLTGLHSRYADDRYEVVVFASDQRQAFVKDEIRGEGITGPYRLSSRSIVLNSEKVRIQVRDRFKSEVVISERLLTRHFDYDVDYVTGTLLFREPVFATDPSFNHVFIVVDYESFDAGDKALTYGARAQTLVGDKLQLGLTHVSEEHADGDVALTGLDAVVHFTPDTSARAEVARTDGPSHDGDAYLLEVDHRSDAAGARAYFREYGELFGLDQNNRSESGTRKTGVEGNYRLDDKLSVRGQAFRQEHLISGGTQDVFESETVFKFDKGSAHAGLRGAREELPTAGTRSSSLLTAGISRAFLNDRLDLLLERDQPVGGDAAAVNYPARTRLGADYRLGDSTSVFLAQEWADGEARESQNTLVGLKTIPWSGGELATSVNRSRISSAVTDAASFALRQKWALGFGWSLDAGFERIETLSGGTVERPNPDVPFASGADGDSTATSLGVTHDAGSWLWNARLDVRNATLEERRGFATSLQTDPRADLSLLFGLQAFARDAKAGEDTYTGNVHLGLAYRPAGSRWIVLDRLDWIRDRRWAGLFEFRDSRIVNNLNANHRVDRWQTSLQYGAKLSTETLDGASFEGYTDLTGVETRFDVTPRWDIGFRASVLHAWDASQTDYQLGLSVGRVLMKNMWLSLGYNVAGFEDRDFAGAEVRRQGPFLAFRVKIDQESLREALHWSARPTSGSAP